MYLEAPKKGQVEGNWVIDYGGATVHQVNYVPDMKYTHTSKIRCLENRKLLEFGSPLVRSSGLLARRIVKRVTPNG